MHFGIRDLCDYTNVSAISLLYICGVIARRSENALFVKYRDMRVVLLMEMSIDGESLDARQNAPGFSTSR